SQTNDIEIKQLRDLEVKIDNLDRDDNEFDKALRDLYFSTLRYSLDESIIQLLLEVLARKIDSLQTSHRERLLGELAEKSIQIGRDRQWLLGFLTRLFQKLQHPERQTEREQVDAEIIIALALSSILSIDPSEWWVTFSAMLSQQATHGSDHVMAV